MNPGGFQIPCPCGATVFSQERETTCPKCRRILALEWEREPEVHVGKPKHSEQSALFDYAPEP
jgi:hypothetical protein